MGISGLDFVIGSILLFGIPTAVFFLNRKFNKGGWIFLSLLLFSAMILSYMEDTF